MLKFTIKTNDGIVVTSEKFITACEPLKFMFKDIKNDGNNKIATLTDLFSKHNLEKYIELVNELNKLEVYFNNSKISYFDYLNNYQHHYITNYACKNKEPPHSHKLASYVNNLGVESITKILLLDKYFSNIRLRQYIMLIIDAFTKIKPKNESDEFYLSIMDKLSDDF